MDEPRNVTPAGEKESIAREESDFWSEPGRTDEGGYWTGTWTTGGRSFPWLGVLLVLIGVALLVAYAFPGVSSSTLVLLAIALAFLAGWIFGRSYVAMIFGFLTLALGVAELIEDMGLLGVPTGDVAGLWSASLAVAFLAIWLVGWATKRRSTWPLWGAAIFGALGAIELSGRLSGFPLMGALWALIIIGVGVFLVWRARSAPG
jgi:hypothetical protein